MKRRSGVRQEIDDLKERSVTDDGNQAFAEAMRELAAEWNTGGWVLEDSQLEELADEGFATPTIDSELYPDLHIVTLSDNAEAHLNDLRSDNDLDEALGVLD